MVLPEDYNFRFVVIIRVAKYLSECDTLKSRENLCEDAMTFFFSKNQYKEHLLVSANGMGTCQTLIWNSRRQMSETRRIESASMDHSMRRLRQLLFLRIEGKVLVP